MSRCDIACAKPNPTVSPQSKDVKESEHKGEKNSAKERLLFCKCTC
ncbi:hypothetical protein [Sulfurospirillum barnesii]|nr:hypothetical protein [Sulfurospirillum barnesii]